MKLVKAVTASKGGGGPPLPKALIERVPEVAPRRFHAQRVALVAVDEGRREVENDEGL